MSARSPELKGSTLKKVIQLAPVPEEAEYKHKVMNIFFKGQSLEKSAGLKTKLRPKTAKVEARVKKVEEKSLL